MNTQEIIIQKTKELADIVLQYAVDIGDGKLVPELYKDETIMDLGIIMSNIFVNRVYYSGKNMEDTLEKAKMCGGEIKDMVMKWTGVDTLHYYDK